MAGRAGAALIFLIIGWIVASIVGSFAGKTAKKLGVDRAVDNLAQESGKKPSGFVPSTIIQKVAFWLILLMVLAGVLSSLGMAGAARPITDLLGGLMASAGKPLAAAAYLLVGWILATLAKSALGKLMTKVNVEGRLVEHKVLSEEAVAKKPIVNLACWGAYGLILLFFVGMAADALQLTLISSSLSEITDRLTSSIPAFLAAALVGLVAWLVATFIKTILANVLPVTGLDSLGKYIGLAEKSETSTEEAPKSLTLSAILASVAFYAVIAFFIPEVLNRLGNESLAQPLRTAWDSIGAFLPNLLSAMLLGVVAFAVCRFVGPLVEQALRSIGFDRVLQLVGLSKAQEAVDQKGAGMSPSRVAGIIVMAFVGLLFAQQGFEQLGLHSFTVLLGGLIGFLPNIIVAVAIVGVGLWVGGFVSSLIVQSATGLEENMRKTLGIAAQAAIVTFASAMALTQVNVAPGLVQNAVLLLIGGISLAIAIAFGLGGKDLAAKKLAKHLDN